MNKIFLFLIVGLLFFQSGNAQEKKDSLFMQFRFRFGALPLELHKDYVSAQGDSLRLTTFKCYISNVRVEYEGSGGFYQSPSAHLLDMEKPASLGFALLKDTGKKIKSISFDIGVDSLKSVSGALAGDLDPARGMYWAWQSGYVNLKIEGKSPSCKSRINKFQFHIGGYQNPYYALRHCTMLPKNGLDVIVDLAEFFATVKLSEIHSIMIPGAKAMELADLAPKMFKPE